MSKKVLPQQGTAKPNFVRKWRQARGLSQEKLADLIDATTSTISRIETGKQGFTAEAQEAIAQALNVDKIDLLCHDPDNQMNTISEEIRKATPEQQEQISRIVRALLASG